MEPPRNALFSFAMASANIGRYDELYDLLSSENMHVFGHDHVGHGKSSGARCWIPSYEVFTTPAKLHIEEMAKAHPGKKIFIYGHSMGGLISMKLLEKVHHLAAGCVLEGPLLGIPDIVPSWVVSLGRFLGRYRLTHWLPVSKVDSKVITHDKDVVKSYDTDPLVFHGAANTKFIASSMDAMEDVFANAASLETPLFIGHGEADHLCPISESAKLFGVIASKDKDFKRYEGAFHVLRSEPFNNTKEHFLAEVVSWINARS